MPRTRMTDEERAAKRKAKAEALRTKRDERKTELRAEIEALASKIPAHIVQGGGTDGSELEGRTRQGYLDCGPVAGFGRAPCGSRRVVEMPRGVTAP